MSICFHKEYDGTKACPRCYPKYDDKIEEKIRQDLEKITFRESKSSWKVIPEKKSRCKYWKNNKHVNEKMKELLKERSEEIKATTGEEY